MADYGFDGMIKVSWLDAVANMSAPTVTELSGGITLEDRLTPDGLATGSDTAEVDTSKLNSTFNSARVGRRSVSPSVTYVRGDDAHAKEVEETLVYGAAGVLAVRRNKLASVAWAAADEVELYPVQCKQPNPSNPAANADQTVEVGMTMTGDPKAYGEPATVAGP